MSRGIKDDPVREAIIERACDWYVRHRGGPLSSAEKDAFLAWLRASQLNMAEYLELVRLRSGLKDVLPTLQFDRAELLQRARAELRENLVSLPMKGSAEVASRAPSPPLPRPWHTRSFAATAATLVTIVIAVWTVNFYRGVNRISVSRGEQRTVQLPDGSTMHLNARSKVSVRYSKTERLIELDDGQALFEVAKDASRRFRVHAGSADVVAVGTQFDVYRKPTGVTVTVVEGKVQVVERDRPIPLSAGEQVRVASDGTPRVAHHADVRAATSWMRRELIFKGEPLSQVVEELNRYIAVPVRIEDEELRAMRVRAVFSAYDSASFLAFLQQYDVDVEVTRTAIHVRRRPAQPTTKNVVADR